MNGKLKTAGIVFLLFLALGAGWALWIGLKALALIAGVGLVIGLGAGVALNARGKRLTGPDESSGVGFTLSDLRQLHKSGQMSDEEFERAKAKVVEAARRASEREQAAAAAKAAGLAADDALRARRPPPDGGMS